MTLDQRVEILLEEIFYCGFKTGIGIDKARARIRRFAKEQDKITRHACAEDIIMLDTTNSIDGDGDVVDIDKAYAAVMNCRGGVR